MKHFARGVPFRVEFNTRFGAIFKGEYDAVGVKAIIVDVRGTYGSANQCWNETAFRIVAHARHRETLGLTLDLNDFVRG